MRMVSNKVGKFYNDLNIMFSIGNTAFYALKIAFERFLRSIPSHSHSSNSYEIHYIAYGQGQITIDHHAYDVIPNTLYITGPHVEHSQIPIKEDPMVEYCIYLKTDTKVVPRTKQTQASLLSSFENTPFWFGQDNQNIHALMQSIFIELDNQYTGYMTQVETLLQQLIVNIIRNYENGQTSSTHFEPSNIVDRSYLIIEDCFLYEYQDITLEKLATRIGLSPRQTERLLSKRYGKTFLQKKTEAKMSAASILLQDKSNRITNVADALGYSSVEHFSTAFRRYYNTSASKFRADFIKRNSE